MTIDSDEEAFLREIEHAQLMHRQHYKQECNKRNQQMKFNERTASMALEQSKELAIQDALRERNHQSELNKQLETERKNAEFWHRVKLFLFRLACAAVVIYTLIHFA